MAGAARARSRLVLLALCLLSAGVYLNSLGNGFALDDYFVIQRNPQVHGLDRLPDAVTGAYLPTGPARLGMYRPLTSATLAIDWEIWDGRPRGFHASNILLHLGATVLLYLLLVHLGSGVLAAGAGAAVFAVHPVHVEAVANVVGRAEILATIFFLVACLAYLRMRPGWGAAIAIGGLYLLSLLSKEIGATLPAALLLLEFVRASDPGTALYAARQRWRVYGILVLVLALYFALRWLNIGALLGGGVAPWFWGEPAATRVWTAVRVFPEYLRLMLMPVELVPDYGPGVIVPERTWDQPLVLLGLATAAAVGAATVLAWQRARLLAVGILWFCLTVLPVSGLLFAAGVLLAERTLYLPSVGLALAVAALFALLRRHRPERLTLAFGVLAILLAAGAVRTWSQNPVWQNTETVLRYLEKTQPASYRTQWFVATNLSQGGQPEAALDHFRLALRMVPGYYNLRAEYARVLFRLGRYGEAAAEYEIATRVVPDLLHAQSRYVESLLLDGRPDEAIAAADRALRRLPQMAVLHHLRSRALRQIGHLHGAREARRHALVLDRGPMRWAHWFNLAALHVATDDPRSAAVALDSARLQAPDSVLVPDLALLRDWVEDGDTVSIPFW